MKLSYVKSYEDQVLLDETYNVLVQSLKTEVQQFIKNLVWNKLQTESDSEEFSYTAKKAKELIDAIDFQKVDKSLHVTRVSNSDQVSAWIHNSIVAPTFGELGLRLNGTYAEQFDFTKNAGVTATWDSLRHVMNDLYRKSVEQDRIDTENRIAANKLAFDSIFEMSGDE